MAERDSRYKDRGCLTIYTISPWADHDRYVLEAVVHTYSVAKLDDDPWRRKHGRRHERCRVGRRFVRGSRRWALLVTVCAVQVGHW